MRDIPSPPGNASNRRATPSDVGEGQRKRDDAIANAMRAGWAGEDADELNWLDVAASAYPGQQMALLRVYGIANRAILELAEVTRAQPEVILKRLLTFS